MTTDPAASGLARAREVARPYAAMITALLDGSLDARSFAAEFEAAWDRQEGSVPDLAYEPINDLAAVAASHDPRFAAEGDTDFATDEQLVAAARDALARLRAALG